MKHMNFVQTAEFDRLPWQPKGYICEEIKKNITSSEVIRGMKLKHCRNVHNNNLYKTVFYIAVAHVLSLL